MNKQEKSSIKTKSFPKWPYSDEREKELLLEVLESGNWWRMTGDKVRCFEKAFSEMHNAKYCIGVTNGTHGIELALSALNIQEGDEVIIPAFTFISTATAVIYCNATPVLVDIDPNTFCMDPDAFERAITPKTKVVIPVHMAGHPCEMDKICAIARRNNIKIIEDAAHAHGAEWKHKKVGTYGEFSVFSFQNGKIMTCGEGGAVLTNNTELYEKAYLIHGVGRPDHDKKYEHLVLGSNYRMNEFQGAILMAQLERLTNMNQKREINAKKLDTLLTQIEGIRPQGRNEDVNINTHYMYMFYYDSSFFGGVSREQFVEELNCQGIPAFIAYPLINNTQFYKEKKFRNHIRTTDKNTNLSYAEKVSKEVVWLPHYTLLGDEVDISEIAEIILALKVKYNRKYD